MANYLSRSQFRSRFFQFIFPFFILRFCFIFCLAYCLSFAVFGAKKSKKFALFTAPLSFKALIVQRFKSSLPSFEGQAEVNKYKEERGVILYLNTGYFSYASEDEAVFWLVTPSSAQLRQKDFFTEESGPSTEFSQDCGQIQETQRSPLQFFFDKAHKGISLVLQESTTSEEIVGLIDFEKEASLSKEKSGPPIHSAKLYFGKQEKKGKGSNSSSSSSSSRSLVFSFKDLNKIEVTYPDKREVTLEIQSVEENISLSSKDFVFPSCAPNKK